MWHLVDYEPIVRLVTFVASLAAVAAAELAAPKRPASVLFIRERWPCNLLLVLLNTLLVRLGSGLLPVALALVLQVKQAGLLNQIHLPWAISCLSSILLLDLAIYIQHLGFHRFRIFWRFHRVHHTDLAMDVTTGVRFHPVEIVISMLYKLLIVLMLGPPPEAVIIFELILNMTSMFSHGNIAIPVVVDRWLRLVLVTPDMHRVHHSVLRNETDSNYGFNLSWWDRIFGTYIDQPAEGHLQMSIGLAEYRNIGELTLWRLLLLPFQPRPDIRPPQV
jgi:sterol desaturase/sphingolipid hydroxylase (fatty acid hydroxylase superfamily)